MAITLRRRPQCHYCGERNKPVNGVGRFKCSHCQADNFLDEHGQITDVPPDVVAPQQQFAVPLTPTFDSSHSIFCSTCLKNQFMYTEAMSNFLPDLDDPEYEKFEAALPAFKQRMEQQFPQCCSKCEPQVTAQLQLATYNARSDHLRRVLEKSRANRLSSAWGWRSLVVNGAGMGYLISLLVQLLWHALGLQSCSQGVSPDIGPVHCLMNWPVSSQCQGLIEPYLSLSVVIGIMCIWWNPSWRHKIQGRQGRLIGLETYYRAQVGIMAIRFSAWLLVKDVPALEPYRPMLHSTSLVLIGFLAVYTNSFIIKIDTTPLVNWHQNPIPLLTAGQFTTQANQIESPPASQDDGFRFQSLGSVQQQQSNPWRPPTPPTDEDAMDWAPSTTSFVPQPKKIVYQSTGPSPFTGTLPAVPKQGIFANRVVNQSKPAKAIGIPPGFFDKSERLRSKNSTTEDFAQPKFFPNNVRSDTGLENIFGKVFSLHDEIIEVRKESPSITNKHQTDIFNTPTMPESIPQHARTMYVAAAACIIIVLSLTIACLVLDTYMGFLDLGRISTLTLGFAMLPTGYAATEFVTAESQPSVGTMSLLLFEAASLVGLSFSCPVPQSVLIPLWTKLVIGILCLMLVQQVYNFYSYFQLQNPLPGLQSSGQDQAREQSAGTYNTHKISSDSAPSQQPLILEPDSLSTPRGNVRSRRDSIDSVSSVSSIMSTSTASGWKTPVNSKRMEYSTGSARSTRSSGLGTGSLGLDNMSIGNSVTGPRTRVSSTRRGRSAW